MSGIEQITVVDCTGKKSIVILTDIKEKSEWITGKELGKDGDSKDCIHLIDRKAIRSRVPMVMNLHYGELERSK